MSGLFWLLSQGDAFSYVHRRGPVPHTSGKRSGRSRFLRALRRFRNTPDRRENGFVPLDEDCLEHGVRVRPSRRPKAFNHFWDEVDRSRDGRSWKAYRPTRYRG